ncbi:hypothetical protein ONE63_003860 [Megalurothrips usitatus]|uniref:NADH-cytochrome b5 reductase n=1 Tax=Megalurothrips usitatus TaxID=439358 RepID=A0AAV7X4C4_9NEOP|nr:hypothetical protein ONE63_003860 [Megalurothrips usitatus]
MSGKELPEAPEKPLPSDCCESGCTPCILDVYEDLLKEWKEKCKLIESGSSEFEEGNASQTPVMFQTKYSTFTVASLTTLTSDTILYRFQAVEMVPGAEDGIDYRNLKGNLDFKPSQYFILQGTETAVGNSTQSFSRAYTPIPMGSIPLGCFDVIIKLYRDGKMSKYLQNLKVGDVTLWRGPYGGFNYKPNSYKRILMICAGTGIAPLYSLSYSIVNDQDDETIIKLLFCCRDEESIILRREIHSLRSFWNFSADIYVPHSNELNCKPLYGETLKTARLGQHTVASELNARNIFNTMVLICGSSQFCKDIELYVRQCNVDSEHIHIF